MCTKCGAGRRAARDEVVLREEKAGEKEKVTSGRQVSAQAEAGTLPAACRDQVPVAALRHVCRAIRVVHRHLRRKVSNLVRSIWPTGSSRGHRCSDQLRSVTSARGTWTRSEPPDAVMAIMQRASPASRWCLAAKVPELGWGICLA